jgi:hypothetical protein
MVPQEGLGIPFLKSLHHHHNIRPVETTVYQCCGTQSTGEG